MSDNPDNLVLNLLRTIRSEIDAIRRTQTEHGHRLATIEVGVAGIRRDIGSDAMHAAEESRRLDGAIERITTIERRLELRDDAG